jgi:nucleoside-diphosphate-sugar epimerase
MPPERIGDPVVRRPDLRRAREELGWSPRIGLDTGLRRMVEWIDAETGALGGS